eukprot:TRINITY_DN33251_c0_g1_i2.p1 TRINITY_DN33251_c0_g1~~TRINITY_DN33251_c0_g1_i2.p1  ORF type:complete len:637 (-),score=75.84 TRINITY_DN33251_c0_g1_i2:311-1969(-)
MVLRLPLLLAKVTVKAQSQADTHFVTVTPAPKHEEEPQKLFSFVLLVKSNPRDLAKCLDLLSSRGAVVDRPAQAAPEEAPQLIADNLNTSIVLAGGIQAASNAEGQRGEACPERQKPEKHVLKIFKQGNGMAWKHLLREASTLTAVQTHANVVRMLGIMEHGIDTGAALRYALKLPYYGQGDLVSAVEERGIFNEDAARCIMIGILRAIDHLNSRRVIHRDVKGENILLTENDIPVLTDFGIACFFDDFEAMKVGCGSPGYIAPEALRSEVKVGPQLDVFGAGVILYYILSQICPFAGPDAATTLRFTLQKEVSFDDDFQERTSSQCRAFIMELLRKDPATRPIAKHALDDTWLLMNCCSLGKHIPEQREQRIADNQDSRPVFAEEAEIASQEGEAGDVMPLQLPRYEESSVAHAAQFSSTGVAFLRKGRRVIRKLPSNIIVDKPGSMRSARAEHNTGIGKARMSARLELAQEQGPAGCASGSGGRDVRSQGAVPKTAEKAAVANVQPHARPPESAPRPIPSHRLSKLIHLRGAGRPPRQVEPTGEEPPQLS